MELNVLDIELKNYMGKTTEGNPMIRIPGKLVSDFFEHGANESVMAKIAQDDDFSQEAKDRQSWITYKFEFKDNFRQINGRNRTKRYTVNGGDWAKFLQDRRLKGTDTIRFRWFAEIIQISVLQKAFHFKWNPRKERTFRQRVSIGSTYQAEIPPIGSTLADYNSAYVSCPVKPEDTCVDHFYIDFVRERPSKRKHEDGASTNRQPSTGSAQPLVAYKGKQPDKSFPADNLAEADISCAEANTKVIDQKPPLKVVYSRRVRAKKETNNKVMDQKPLKVYSRRVVGAYAHVFLSQKGGAAEKRKTEDKPKEQRPKAREQASDE